MAREPSKITPEITRSGNVITVTGTPENSTLIIALYKDRILSGVKLYKGSGIVTADLSEHSVNADTAKLFLWDMRKIQPLTPNALEVHP